MAVVNNIAMQHVLADIYKEAQDAHTRNIRYERSRACLPDGYSSIDELTNSLNNGNLYVISGCVGKTKKELLVDLVANYVSKFKNEPKLLIFVRKGGAHDWGRELLSLTSGVPCSKLISGNLKTKDWCKLAEATGELADLDIEFDESEPPVDIMVQNCLTKHQEVGLGLVVVDYLQSMKNESIYPSGFCSTREVLKELVNNLDLPVIAISEECDTSDKPLWSSF